MITREEAERISAVWAHRESLRRGYECAPMVDEFELGYIVWSAPPPSVATLPGDIGRTVIDKQTGEVTSWAALPGPLIPSPMTSAPCAWPSAAGGRCEPMLAHR